MKSGSQNDSKIALVPGKVPTGATVTTCTVTEIQCCASTLVQYIWLYMYKICMPHCTLAVECMSVVLSGMGVSSEGWFVVVYLYLTSAKCTGIPAFSLWPEATALTEMVKVELHERKKMKF